MQEVARAYPRWQQLLDCRVELRTGAIFRLTVLRIGRKLGVYENRVCIQQRTVIALARPAPFDSSSIGR